MEVAMAATKAYTGAQIVADLCKVVGVLSVVAGIACLFAARDASKIAERQQLAILYLGSAAAGIVWGLLLFAVGQVVEAIIDTAKNTAEAANNSAAITDLLAKSHAALLDQKTGPGAG
jgi:hypothetical protein